MTLVADRVADLRTQKLKELIQILVDVVQAQGGTMSQREAMRSAAAKAGLSVSEMPYIVNSAVADHRITADLRSGKLQLIS